MKMEINGLFSPPVSWISGRELSFSLLFPTFQSQFSEIPEAWEGFELFEELGDLPNDSSLDTCRKWHCEATGCCRGWGRHVESKTIDSYAHACLQDLSLSQDYDQLKLNRFLIFSFSSCSVRHPLHYIRTHHNSVFECALHHHQDNIIQETI